MKLEVISYHDLLDSTNTAICNKVKSALLNTGIIGISDVPEFQEKSLCYINAVRQFIALNDTVKLQYAPDRDVGETEGYEVGAEWFKDQAGEWQIDDKKASFYAYVPDRAENKWPLELDLKTPYIELGELIFQVGKHVLNFIGLDNTVGINHDGLTGYGRMLHYHKIDDTTQINPNWCGAHLDHGVFTGLMPAYYFKDGKEVEEPAEAGLYIMPSNSNQFEKINASDKSILLFQVGEFAQLASHDQIRATKHLVKKAHGNIERFTFALFYSADDEAIINSNSELKNDSRYIENMAKNGEINYGKWQAASFARYRAVIADKKLL